MLTDEQKAEGWIKWDGGICPVDPQLEVTYRLRYFRPDDPPPLGPCPAGMLRWDHGRTPESAADALMRRNDIIAYRPEPQP
jgi:hypothetical protein